MSKLSDFIPQVGATTLIGLTDTPSGYNIGKFLQSTVGGSVWTTVTGSELDHSQYALIDGTRAFTGAVDIQSSLTLQNGTTINEFSTDTTLSGNSDDAVPTEKVVKTYVDEQPKFFGLMPYASDEAVVSGTGTIGVCIPVHINGCNITAVIASVSVSGTTGTTDIQIRRKRAASEVDVLSTECTIDSGEHSSATAATAAVINTSNDDLVTGDLIYADIDVVSTTAPQGLSITITATKP